MNDLKLNNHQLYNDILIQSSLIALYGKCGDIEKALNLFKENINRIKNNKDKLLIYSSMMDCYAKNGNIKDVINLFEELKELKIEIDKNVYCIIINACSHAGYVKEAKLVFEYIKNKKHRIDGYLLTSIIDCFARNNELKDAENIYDLFGDINDYFYKEKESMLLSILSHSCIYNDVIRAERIVKRIENLYKKNDHIDNVNPSIYILLSNLHSKIK